ncbi:hypothetical protein J6Z48_02950 [bacterium]|nr:hypothetical protein [bacterium]
MDDINNLDNNEEEVELEISLTLPNILTGILFVTLIAFVVKIFGATFTKLAQNGLRGWIAILFSSVLFIVGINEVVQFLRELYIVLYIKLYLGLDSWEYYIKNIEDIDE